RRHTRFSRDWSSDVCSSDLHTVVIKQHWPSSFHQGQKRGGVFYTVFCTLLTGAKVQLAVRHHREHRFIHGQGITAKQGAMMNFRSEERRVGKECKFPRL